MAYQIAFDLYENATQQFLTSVVDKLKSAIPLISDTSEDNESNNQVSYFVYQCQLLLFSIHVIQWRTIHEIWGTGEISNFREFVLFDTPGR